MASNSSAQYQCSACYYATDDLNVLLHHFCTGATANFRNAPVNSTCAQHPPGSPPGISNFFALDGKFPGVGTPELSNPPGWGRTKRVNAPSSVNAATFFIVIPQSKSAILSILMCDFLFHLTSSFVIALGF